LFEQLNTGLQRKLTLISAPAGFGKTMLLAAWLDQRENNYLPSRQPAVSASQRGSPPAARGFSASPFKAAWLSLDDDDNDPVRFFINVTTALETIQADVGADSLARLQAPQPPSLKTVLTMLLNDLAIVSTNFVLVLDDYHLIEQPSIHEGLTFLLDHLPPQMHLFIAGRSDPPLPLARLRTRNQLTELRAADLRFTLDEAVNFLNQAMGLALLPEEMMTLENRTEGWIAGLQLAALSMQGRSAESINQFIAAFGGSHRHVIDYLAEEVMARQPVEIQEFLCQTSILDRLTAPLCDTVTGRTNSEAVLRRLEQANLFLIPLDDQRQWYRYHRLFADFLRSRLQQILPERIPELHRRASGWYERHGLSAAAIDHALSGRDYKRVASLIEEVADTILMRSELATLQRWIEALPDNVVRTRPLLCVYYALALVMDGKPLERAQSRLQESIEAGMADPASGEVVAFRAWIAALQGDTDQTIELSQQALELLPEKNLFLRSLVAASVGLVYTWSGDVGPAFQAFDEVARIGKLTGNVMLSVLALRRLAEISLLQGHLNQAKMFFEQALELGTDGQGQPRPIAGLAVTGLGWLLLERNELEGAARRLEEGIELTSRWSDVASLQGHIGLALVKQAQGDAAGADQAIQTARRLATRLDATEMDDILVEAYQARLWTMQGIDDPGRLVRVLAWLEKRALGRETALRELKQEAGNVFLPLVRALEYIPLARLYIAQGQLDDALALLEPLLQKVETAGWMWFGIEILTLQAVAYQHRGDTTQALAALERALTLAKPEGLVRIFLDSGPPMRELLQQAAARGVAVDHVGKLLAAFFAGEEESLPESSFTLATALAEPLSQRELEVLRLIAAGLSNREIAEELVVAISTVKTHIRNIYGKLDVSSRTQALVKARELKLI